MNGLRAGALVVALFVAITTVGVSVVSCVDHTSLRSVLSEVDLPDELRPLESGQKAYAPGGPQFAYERFEIPSTSLQGRSALAWFCDQRVAQPTTIDPQLLGGRMDRECSSTAGLRLTQLYRSERGKQVLLVITETSVNSSWLIVRVRSISPGDFDGSYS